MVLSEESIEFRQGIREVGPRDQGQVVLGEERIQIQLRNGRRPSGIICQKPNRHEGGKEDAGEQHDEGSSWRVVLCVCSKLPLTWHCRLETSRDEEKRAGMGFRSWEARGGDGGLRIISPLLPS